MEKSDDNFEECRISQKLMGGYKLKKIQFCAICKILSVIKITSFLSKILRQNSI